MLGTAEIEAARQRLKGALYETPCPYSQTLSEMSGVRCFVKLENLQMTGSFKERGAANLLLQLGPAERARGVAAASAGNHGLAVAFHAARLGIGAVIVMPEWAPLIKVTSSRRYGAEVILAGANYDEAYGRARDIATERGLTFVHPFDDERVIAGQGTLGGVSCTGDGEAIIRVALARRALDYLKEADDATYAAQVAVDLLVEEGLGQGGLILLDWRGRIGWAHSTRLMPVAFMSPTFGEPRVSF